MKTQIISLLLLFTACTLPLKAQKTVVIEQPYYEVKNSGIDNISKIELTPTQTRVHVHATFLANWWVKFPKETFIQPTGKNERILATGIEGGEFDKEIYMPESGDSTFVLIFPPLDKSVKSFDYGRSDKTIIVGVSLEKNAKKLNAHKKAEQEKNALKWIEKEVAQSEPELPDYNPATFFQSDTARVVGYIKGYSPKLGFSTGIVYASNILTHEDFPIVINIHPDGRFEGNIPLIAPSIEYISINETGFNLYLEPGRTLGIVLNWDEFLQADRYRDRMWEFNDVAFFGPLANVNNSLLTNTLKHYDGRNYEQDIKSLSPEAFKQKLQDILNENLQIIEKEKTNGLTGKALTIKQNEAWANYAELLMGFALMREYYLKEDTTNAVAKMPIIDDFYDFLHALPLNDPAFLIPSYSRHFINRFEYADFFRLYSLLYKSPEMSFSMFLEQEKKIVFTEDDKMVADYYKKVVGQPYTQKEWEADRKYRDENKEAFETFEKKYEKEQEEYYKLYLAPLEMSKEDQFRKECELKDSVLMQKFQLTPNLICDITKTRSLGSYFRYAPPSKQAGINMLNIIESAVAHPFLKSEAIRLFNQQFPEVETDSYELPQTAISETFKQIIAPHKGKYILVDFWGIYCSPCIQGIKQMKEKREELKDSEDIVFLFITGESDSPKDRYDKLVEEQGLVYTHRLSTDDFNRLRELFKFNGIPHYETIGRSGNVLKNPITPYSFEHEFQQVLEKEKAANR